MRNEIVRELVDAIKKVTGEEYSVSSSAVKKNNGVELTAITVRKQGENISPAIYIDDLIEKIEKGKITVGEAADKVFGVYQDNRAPEFDVDIQKLTNKEYILSHVEYQLINAERNAEKLAKIPSRRFADLAVIYRVIMKNDEDGITSYIIHNGMMDNAGISIEELDRAAMENTKKVGFISKTIMEIASEMMNIPEELSPCFGIESETDGVPQMYILTNKRGMNGANILLYTDEIAKLADKLEDDLYILPSSIHEVIAIPAKNIDTDALRQMVREVNDTQLDKDEILGYEVYKFDRETREISCNGGYDDKEEDIDYE